MDGTPHDVIGGVKISPAHAAAEQAPAAAEQTPAAAGRAPAAAERARPRRSVSGKRKGDTDGTTSVVAAQLSDSQSALSNVGQGRKTTVERLKKRGRASLSREQMKSGDGVTADVSFLTNVKSSDNVTIPEAKLSSAKMGTSADSQMKLSPQSEDGDQLETRDHKATELRVKSVKHKPGITSTKVVKSSGKATSVSALAHAHGRYLVAGALKGARSMTTANSVAKGGGSEKQTAAKQHKPPGTGIKFLQRKYKRKATKIAEEDIYKFESDASFEVEPEPTVAPPIDDSQKPKPRGRPKGSKNKKTLLAEAKAKRNPSANAAEEAMDTTETAEYETEEETEMIGGGVSVPEVGVSRSGGGAGRFDTVSGSATAPGKSVRVEAVTGRDVTDPFANVIDPFANVDRVKRGNQRKRPVTIVKPKLKPITSSLVSDTTPTTNTDVSAAAAAPAASNTDLKANSVPPPASEIVTTKYGGKKYEKAKYKTSAAKQKLSKKANESGIPNVTSPATSATSDTHTHDLVSEAPASDALTSRTGRRLKLKANVVSLAKHSHTMPKLAPIDVSNVVSADVVAGSTSAESPSTDITVPTPKQKVDKQSSNLKLSPKALTPGTAKVTSPGTTKAASPGTTKAASPGTTKAASPGTTKAASPGTTKATSPGTTKATSPRTPSISGPADDDATTDVVSTDGARPGRRRRRRQLRIVPGASSSSPSMTSDRSCETEIKPPAPAAAAAASPMTSSAATSPAATTTTLKQPGALGLETLLFDTIKMREQLRKQRQEQSGGDVTADCIDMTSCEDDDDDTTEDDAGGATGDESPSVDMASAERTNVFDKFRQHISVRPWSTDKEKLVTKSDDVSQKLSTKASPMTTTTTVRGRSKRTAPSLTDKLRKKLMSSQLVKTKLKLKKSDPGVSSNSLQSVAVGRRGRLKKSPVAADISELETPAQASPQMTSRDEPKASRDAKEVRPRGRPRKHRKATDTTKQKSTATKTDDGVISDVRQSAASSGETMQNVMTKASSDVQSDDCSAPFAKVALVTTTEDQTHNTSQQDVNSVTTAAAVTSVVAQPLATSMSSSKSPRAVKADSSVSSAERPPVGKKSGSMRRKKTNPSELEKLMENLVEAYGNVPRGNRNARANDVSTTLENLQLPAQRANRKVAAAAAAAGRWSKESTPQPADGAATGAHETSSSSSSAAVTVGLQRKVAKQTAMTSQQNENQDDSTTADLMTSAQSVDDSDAPVQVGRSGPVLKRRIKKKRLQTTKKERRLKASKYVRKTKAPTDAESSASAERKKSVSAAAEGNASLVAATRRQDLSVDASHNVGEDVVSSQVSPPVEFAHESVDESFVPTIESTPTHEQGAAGDLTNDLDVEPTLDPETSSDGVREEFRLVLDMSFDPITAERRSRSRERSVASDVSRMMSPTHAQEAGADAHSSESPEDTKAARDFVMMETSEEDPNSSPGSAKNVAETSPESTKIAESSSGSAKNVETASEKIVETDSSDEYVSAAEETPVKETPVEKPRDKEKNVRNAPVKETSFENDEAPAKAAPDQKAPAETTSGNKTSAVETPVNEEPTNLQTTANDVLDLLKDAPADVTTKTQAADETEHAGGTSSDSTSLPVESTSTTSAEILTFSDDDAIDETVDDDTTTQTTASPVDSRDVKASPAQIVDETTKTPPAGFGDTSVPSIDMDDATATAASDCDDTAVTAAPSVVCDDATATATPPVVCDDAATTTVPSRHSRRWSARRNVVSLYSKPQPKSPDAESLSPQTAEPTSSRGRRRRLVRPGRSTDITRRTETTDGDSFKIDDNAIADVSASVMSQRRRSRSETTSKSGDNEVVRVADDNDIFSERLADDKTKTDTAPNVIVTSSMNETKATKTVKSVEEDRLGDDASTNDGDQVSSAGDKVSAGDKATSQTSIIDASDISGDVKMCDDVTPADDVATTDNGDGERKLAAWEKSRRKKQLKKLRGKKLAQIAKMKHAQARKAAAAAVAAAATEECNTAAAGNTPPPTSSYASAAKLPRGKKRSEIELLFDVDGPPSTRRKRRAFYPEQERKTILGQRIEVDSKRSITRRVRHLSETSLSSTDLLSPDDTVDLVEPMDDLEMSNDVSQTASSVDQKTSDKLGQPEVETEEADDISQKPETPTSSPESDSGTKMTTRGKKNRYWYLFAKQDRKGNVQSMLSRPDNADITQYQQYRHSLAAKYSGTEGAKLERQKSAPGTSGELQTVDQSANKEPKVPKIVLKLPKKVKKYRSEKAYLAYKNQPKYPIIKHNDDVTHSSSLSGRRALPSDAMKTDPVKYLTDHHLKPSERNLHLLSLCDPDFQVKVIDLIKFLKATGNDDLVPSMPEARLTSHDAAATDDVIVVGSIDSEPPILTDKTPIVHAVKHAKTPPKSAYELQFMSFIDRHQHATGAEQCVSDVNKDTHVKTDEKKIGDKLNPTIGSDGRPLLRSVLSEAQEKAAENSLKLEAARKELAATLKDATSVKTAQPHQPQQPQQQTLPAKTASSSAIAVSPAKPAIVAQGIVLQKTTSYRPILPKVTPGSIPAVLPKVLPSQTYMLIPVTSAAQGVTPLTLTTSAESKKIAPQSNVPKSPAEAILAKAAQNMSTPSHQPSETDSNVSLSKISPNSISTKALLERIQQNTVLAQKGGALAKSILATGPQRKFTARKSMPRSRKIAAQLATAAKQLATQPNGGAVTPQRYRCLCCTYTCQNRTVMTEHVYNHTNIVPYSCGYCGAIFGTRSGVMVHTKRDHPTKEKLIVKNSSMDEEQYYCSAEEYARMRRNGPVPLKTVERMSPHNSVATSSASQQSSATPSKPSTTSPASSPSSALGTSKTRVTTTTVMSSNAKQTLTSADDAVRSLLATERTEFKCRFCAFTAPEVAIVERHVDAAHPKDRRFVCPLCKVSFFKQLESMKKHIQKWHKGASVDSVPYEPGYVVVKQPRAGLVSSMIAKGGVASIATAATTVSSVSTAAGATALSSAVKSAPASRTDLTAVAASEDTSLLSQNVGSGYLVTDVKSLAVTETSHELATPAHTTPAGITAATVGRTMSPEYMCKEITSTSDICLHNQESANHKQDPSTNHKQEEKKFEPMDVNSHDVKLQQEQKHVTLEKVYQCRFCRKDIADFAAACAHIEQNHYLHPDYRCPYCHVTARRPALQSHIATVHSDRPQTVQQLVLENQDGYFKVIEKPVADEQVSEQVSAAGKMIIEKQEDKSKLQSPKRYAASSRRYETTTVNVAAASTEETDDQPLDFSVKVKSATVTSAPSSSPIDLTELDDVVLDLSAKPTARSASNTQPPPPPLKPMGVARDATLTSTSQLRLNAPPLIRAPVATAPTGAGSSSAARGGDVAPCDESHMVVIADDSSSDEDDDDIAREVFSVFNLLPPSQQQQQQHLSLPPGLYEPPVAHPSTFFSPPQPQPQLHVIQPEAPQPPNYRPFQVQPSISIQQSRFQGAVNAAGSAHARRVAPPPNVVVGGPGMSFTPSIPPQLSRLLSCPKCSFRSSSYELMRAHILNHGAANIDWTCQYCPVSLKMAKAVAEQHIMTCHPEAPVVAVPFGLHPND